MRKIIEYMSDRTDKVMTTDIQAVFASLQTEAVNALSDSSSADNFFELKSIRGKLTDALDGSAKPIIEQANQQITEQATELTTGHNADLNSRQNILNAVTTLFEYIQTETNLPDPVRQILVRLYLPYLKVALIEDDFFNNEQHPARRLLELLYRSSVGWVYEDEQSGEHSGNGFLAHLSSLITQIVKNFLEDVFLFDEACKNLNQFILDESRQTEINEDRVIEMMKGKENMRLAQVHVAKIINEKVCHQQELPVVVTDLLRDGWKDVLTLAFFRQGPDSEKFQKLLGIMEKLLWSVKPKNKSEERQELMKTIPDLLRDLRNELVEISYDEHKLTVALKQLQASHIQALKGMCHSIGPVDELIPLPLLADSDSENTPLDEAAQTVLKLQVGDWIKWQVASGRTVQGKLLWKSDASGTMVFVSRIGTKLAELMQKDLADLINTGKVQLMTDINQPVFDLALNQSV